MSSLAELLADILFARDQHVAGCQAPTRIKLNVPFPSHLPLNSRTSPSGSEGLMGPAPAILDRREAAFWPF